LQEDTGQQVIIKTSEIDVTYNFDTGLK